MKNSKVSKYCLLAILFSANCLSQTQFQRVIGGAGDDRAWSVVQTTDGGYVVAGETSSSGAGGLDFGIVMLDSSGAIQWGKTIGGISDDVAQSVIQTADGGFLMTGFTSSFGTLLEHDMYIVKLNAAGSMQWDKTIRGTGDEVALSTVQTTDGGYVVAGSTSSFGAGSYDLFIVKLDSGGTLQWSKTIGGADDEFAYSIIQASDGGYAITGYSFSFGAGLWDAIIVKLNSGGTLQWCKTVGGTNTDAGYSIIQTADGGYAVAGYTISFGAGYVDLYVIKLDSTGTVQWTRTVGGSGIDVAFTILQTSDGGYTIAGYTYSFGAGNDDMYIVRLNAAGMLQWSKTIGGAVYDDAWSIDQTTDGGYAVAGRTNSFGGFNYEMYLVKLDASGNSCVNTAASPSVPGTGGTSMTQTPGVSSPVPLVQSQLPSVIPGITVNAICSALGIRPVSSEIPGSYNLHQNYPNPFNPNTRIGFDIPAPSLNKGLQPFVRIKIYDILGREMTTLVNENLSPGTYEVDWDATNYPSGIYYYKLTTGDFVDAKKMMLVK